MTETETARYNSLLPKLAELAGVDLNAPFTGNAHNQPTRFRPLYDDGDCFKLLCRLREKVGKNGYMVHLFGTAVPYCRIAGWTEILIEKYGETDREAVCLCAMAYVEREQ